ncbi:hypothetical protein SAMN02745127_00733 [Oceanospirillum multiglobuliferum]|uniref:Uncharacterized protein n=1 Tax=Oceanospirillum multiglobuliferum TaxID=64969 RepID=A0A1T4MB15_9GAMM|nr:hypothetical protein [Oceanospirillum multiglobuliferum]OPX56178.1 hypothetical protein BTE48_04155 [Oceanospirillum multiglobuliferum]SJZ63894.1 hypothetical protein SAMN02745127_00733 [Oceanospirillum multiglobuliferum]
MGSKITQLYSMFSDVRSGRSNTDLMSDIGLSPTMQKSNFNRLLSFLKSAPYWQLVAILWFLLALIWAGFTFLFSKPQIHSVISSPQAMPQECQYLKHFFLDAEPYQLLATGRMACVSSIRYFGHNKRHGIRYAAFGTLEQIEEMRLSLRMSQYDLQAIKELIRFGNSLALPVMGHTLPVEVGQVLQSNENSQWQYGVYQVRIERQNLNAQTQDVHLIIQMPTSEASRL